MVEGRLEGVALVAGEVSTGWKRAVVDEDLAKAAGCAPLWLILQEEGASVDHRRASLPSDQGPDWRAADRSLDQAARYLEDIRDAEGVLVEVAGPVAPALASRAFRQAALTRLGARQAFAASPDGVQLRLRDAWRTNPADDVAALESETGWRDVWLLDGDGVSGVVVDGFVVHAAGGRTAVRAELSTEVDRDQVVFARALLAFLGGILLSLGLALALSLR